MAEHELKVWPIYYEEIELNNKTFEVRLNDRDFKKGDFICLREYNPDKKQYTGRFTRAVISYIFYGGIFKIPQDMCIFSFIKLTPLKMLENGLNKMFKEFPELTRIK